MSPITKLVDFCIDELEALGSAPASPRHTVPGPCETEETAMDARLSWHDGDTNGSAAMPLGDCRRLLASKAIVIEGIQPP